MKSYLYIIIFLFIQIQAVAQSHKLQFKTSYGSFKVVLYDFTPNHQKLILNALKNKVYEEVFFNRIIENFVVQGGEHDDSIAEREKQIPTDEHYRLAPEFNEEAFHKLGALGAGRDDNMQKASFLNQIYFVVGKPVSEKELSDFELKKRTKFTEKQRKEYLINGGLPRLDGDYTVFGEVYEGLDVLITISRLTTDEKDAPLKPIPFEVSEILETIELMP